MYKAKMMFYTCGISTEKSKWDPSLQVAINTIMTDNLSKNDTRKQIFKTQKRLFKALCLAQKPVFVEEQ